MRSIILLYCVVLISATTLAQGDFRTQVATAKQSYAAGKLEEAHFALQQALQELDLIVGKEVLKLMPQKLDTLLTNAKDDRVGANVGFIGATIHRSYGNQNKVDIEIINNSPLVNTLTSFLNSGMFGGMMRDDKTKVVKVQGYKARLEKQSEENGPSNYELQIPFSGALMTVRTKGMEENQVLSAVNSFPLADIAKLIQ